MAFSRWWVALGLLSGCTPEGAGPEGAAARAVVGSDDHLLVVEPGLPPLEAPRRSVLWTRSGAGWRPGARVLDVAWAGRVVLSPSGVLSLDGVAVATGVSPPLVEAPDGRLAFAAGEAPESDVFVLHPGASAPVRLTTDTYSDRPTWLPDGDLLWVSGGSGVVGFVRAGRRLTNLPGTPVSAWTPVPSDAARTAFDPDTGRVRFFGGAAWFSLDVDTGAVHAEVDTGAVHPDAVKPAGVAP